MAARKKTKKTAKKKINALDFARAYLRRRPKAPFADVRDAAKKKRLTLYPISYGRAQALEGIVKISAYGSKKKKKAKSKRGPGRPKGSKNKRTRSRSGGLGLENLVSTIQNLQRERDQAVDMVAQIRRIIG